MFYIFEMIREGNFVIVTLTFEGLIKVQFPQSH